MSEMTVEQMKRIWSDDLVDRDLTIIKLKSKLAVVTAECDALLEYIKTWRMNYTDTIQTASRCAEICDEWSGCWFQGDKAKEIEQTIRKEFNV